MEEYPIYNKISMFSDWVLSNSSKSSQPIIKKNSRYGKFNNDIPVIKESKFGNTS